MEECTKGWDWTPSSVEDSTNWQSHSNCSSHLARILKFEGTNSDVVLEILKTGALGTYRAWGFFFWEIPNLDPRGLEWIDQESLNWPLKTSFNYWVERYARFDSQGHLIETEPESNLGFGSKILTQDLDLEESYKETFRIASPFAQHIWHDLWKQGTVDFIYHEDSVYGDTFRPSMPRLEFESAEDYLDVLSDGFFTSWISHENVIDMSYGTGYVSERIENEGFRWYEEIDDTSLCMALVYGDESNDLEITGDLDSYFDQSGLFGETDREYPVTVESEPDWNGKKYIDLSNDEQANLANNFLLSNSHPLLIANSGVVVHLLICLALHESTTPQTRELLSRLEIPAVTAAIDYFNERESTK